jgi:hypothetical protein
MFAVAEIPKWREANPKIFFLLQVMEVMVQADIRNLLK